MEFLYKNTALIKHSEILSAGRELTDYIRYLKKVTKKPSYEVPESFINLTHDEDILKSVQQVKRKLGNKKLKYVVVVGIGGSNLGAKAVYDALYGYFDLLTPMRFPKIIFADTTDAAFIQKLKTLLAKADPEEILINAISKSGNTTETIANLEILLAKNPGYKKRLVITTDFGTDLWRQAQEGNIMALPIPQVVVGRYSIFTAVGLLPLALAGVKVFTLIEGAMQVRPLCLYEDIAKNPAAISAILLYLQMKKGRSINDNFFFLPELESLGKWYRQLMAESTGKRGMGITPTVSIGSADLHSVGQLYVGGPHNKFFTFVTAKNSDKNVKVPTQEPVSTPLEINGLSLTRIQDAILTGVEKLYTHKEIPYTEIVLAEVSENALGKFIQFKMFEIIYLAKLMGVNAFDQPNVEEYKTITKKLLHKL